MPTDPNTPGNETSGLRGLHRAIVPERIRSIHNKSSVSSSTDLFTNDVSPTPVAGEDIVRTRLQLAIGTDAEVDVIKDDGGGTEVTTKLNSGDRVTAGNLRIFDIYTDVGNGHTYNVQFSNLVSGSSLTVRLAYVAVVPGA